MTNLEQQIEAIMLRLDKVEAGLFGNAGKAKPQEKLRDFVVPLRHATLTREEVAARCVAAAEKKGYKRDLSEPWCSVSGLAYNNQPMTYFMCHSNIPFGFRHHDCQNLGKNSLTTLEAFEEYCGVEQPQQYLGLADETAEPQVHGIVNTLDAPASGNSGKPNTHEATAQPVYEAGFVFCPKGICALRLPDDTKLWYSEDDSAWRKDRPFYKPKPHTLTPVGTYTVGRFYAVKGARGEHLNDFRNYALCVKNGEWPYFVKPKIEDGIVVVESNTLVHVSNLEVTPV